MMNGIFYPEPDRTGNHLIFKNPFIKVVNHSFMCSEPRFIFLLHLLATNFDSWVNLKAGFVSGFKLATERKKSERKKVSGK